VAVFSGSAAVSELSREQADQLEGMCCLLGLEERLHAAALALRQHQRLGQDDIFQLQRRPLPRQSWAACSASAI
jgi:hypothetical protein